MLYNFLKFLHVLGAITLIGNVTVTAFWKVFADRIENPEVIGYAQALVTRTDFVFTLLGITLIMLGGYGMVWVADLRLNEPRWLILGQFFFILSGLIWIGVLVPLQIRQARAANHWKSSGDIPISYWRDGRAWLIWGIIATVPLVASVYVMVVKP